MVPSPEVAQAALCRKTPSEVSGSSLHFQVKFYCMAFANTPKRVELHCSHKVTDENFKISSPILLILTPKFHSNSVLALCEG